LKTILTEALEVLHLWISLLSA